MFLLSGLLITAIIAFVISFEEDVDNQANKFDLNKSGEKRLRA
jgi:hypothetical protein